MCNEKRFCLLKITFNQHTYRDSHVLLSFPEGKPGMSDVSPLSGNSGLSFDSRLLSPLLFFWLVLLLFPSYVVVVSPHAGPFS